MRRAMQNVVLAMVVGGCGMVPAVAQMGGGAATAQAGTMVAPAKAMDAVVRFVEGDIVPAVEAMPADKFDFKPKSTILPGATFDSVNDFSGMAKHLAQANYSFFSAVGAMKPDVDVKAIKDLKSKDEIVAALKKSFVFAHAAVATLTPENSWQAVERGQTRASLVGIAAAHGMDHYGQLVEYLRMNGIVPPASRK